MYGNILKHELPTKLKESERPDIFTPGFYEIEFSSGSESLACSLPIRVDRGAHKGSVRHAKAGRGVY
jgi:hypothetical protein